MLCEPVSFDKCLRHVCFSQVIDLQIKLTLEINSHTHSSMVMITIQNLPSEFLWTRFPCGKMLWKHWLMSNYLGLNPSSATYWLGGLEKIKLLGPQLSYLLLGMMIVSTIWGCIEEKLIDIQKAVRIMSDPYYRLHKCQISPSPSYFCYYYHI